MRFGPDSPRSTNIEDRRGQRPEQDSLLYAVNSKMERLRREQAPLNLSTAPAGRRVQLMGEEGEMIVLADERGNQFRVPKSVAGGAGARTTQNEFALAGDGGPSPQPAQPAPQPVDPDRKVKLLADLRGRLGL